MRMLARRGRSGNQIARSPIDGQQFSMTSTSHARRIGYPISAIRLDAQDWAVHDAEQWTRLLDAKRRFDPANTLASGPDVLGVR